jgi:FkbM family methyltransferase
MSKKTKKLTTSAQPADWFQTVTNECRSYPIDLVDIHSDELVVDIGANVGGFYEAWKGRFTKWIAVEPSVYNCEQYKINTGRNVEIQKAVWDKSGETLKLQGYIGNGETPSGNFGVTGFVNESNEHGWQGDYEEVETISFDDLFGSAEVGLLKIDCEGAEFKFLYKKDLSKVKYIVGEFHNFLFQTDDSGVELLDWISQTHEEIYSEGNGVDSHYVKLFKRK